MLSVRKEGVVLEKSSMGFESHAVLNPAIIMVAGVIHMFYRAVAKDNYSTIGHCTFSSPMQLETRSDVPVLFPQLEFECQGIEDPRIVCIDGMFYLSYTGFDGLNALGAVATSMDLEHWEKGGVVVPQIAIEEFRHLSQTRGALNEKYVRFNKLPVFSEIQPRKVLLWDKNIVFFPRRIAGSLAFLHRIKPDIQLVKGIATLAELTPDFWQNYFLSFSEKIVMSPAFPHEVSYLGGGCPPIEMELGWLLIYHGVHDTIEGYVYSACAAVLDIDCPEKVLYRLPYPLFYPEETWERSGAVNNVCFPSGALIYEGRLYVYYGAADERIALASMELQELCNELKKFPN
ncbi:MAG: hypothetical protein RIT42_893 [Bacteroidota bacterium]|jgi:predicted GH43/DUF377 family glycosyl hydrolase